MANSSFFKDGGSGSGTFQTIETKIAEAEAAKVAAEAAQVAAEQAETDAQTAEAGSVAAKNTAVASSGNAAISESNAASSAANASNKASDTQKLAINPEDSQYTLSDGSTTGYSALHYNEKAADSLASTTTQASNAAASAVTAGQHKDDAESAKTSAESARDSALASFDSFDDRYLGAKNSDPSVDNDGNSLVAGALYFNEQSGDMKVYNGTSWVDAYADGATLVAKAGDTMTGDLSFGDNDKAIFGAGSDLQIYHDGSHSYIHEVGTGDLRLKVNDLTVQSTNGSYMMRGVTNGAVSLYYSNFPKLDTTSTGIDVAGTVTADGLTVDGSSVDMITLNHSTPTDTVTIGQDSSGDFRIRNGGTNRLKSFANGDFELYEDTGTTAKLQWLASDEALKFADNSKAIFGAGSDLQIYHDGSHSYIKDAGTGDLLLRGDNLRLQSASGENYLYALSNGATLLYNNNAQKLATTSTGVDVTGTVTADGLSVVAPTGNLEALLESTGGTPSILFKSASGTVNTRIKSGIGGAANLTFETAGSERMRIESSGSVLVGKTTTDVGTQGARLDNSGRGFFTRSASFCLQANRLSSDGEIMRFSKDGTIVGSIGAVNDDIFIAGGDANHAALRFAASSKTVLPVTNSGSLSDNTTDLGQSAARFKNLYLSGGLRADTLTFSTVAGSEAMRIDSGRVGIGNSSPDTNLEISDTSGAVLRLSGTTGGGVGTTPYDIGSIEFKSDDTSSGGQQVVGVIRCKATTASTIPGGELRFENRAAGGGTALIERMRLETDGDLHVDGNVVAYSTTISDIRLKKDIAPIEDAVTKVQQLNGCTFTYLKDDRQSAGLIAQDLEKVLPSAVIEDEAVFHGEEGETYKTVQYDQVIGLLVEAVKELKQEIEELKKG